MERNRGYCALAFEHRDRLYLIPRDAESIGGVIELNFEMRGRQVRVGINGTPNVAYVRGKIIEQEGGLAAFIRAGKHKNFGGKKSG